jgi:hypothetical protein
MKTEACGSGGNFERSGPLQFLAAKRADPDDNTSAWEREIDEHVYRLYGLTDEEIKIVDESASDATRGTSTARSQDQEDI